MKFDLDDVFITLGQVGTPSGTAFAIGFSLYTTFDWPGWIAVATAIGVEATGIGICRVTLKQWDEFGRAALPFGTVLLAGYALIASVLIGVFDGNWALALLPWMTILGSAAAGWYSNLKHAQSVKQEATNLARADDERNAELQRAADERKAEQERQDAMELKRLRAQFKHEEKMAQLQAPAQGSSSTVRSSSTEQRSSDSELGAKLIELFTQNPDLSGSEAARMVGASPSRANRIKKELSTNGNGHNAQKGD